MRNKRTRRGGHRASHSTCRGLRVKVRYTEVRKEKEKPEAKGSRDNLRKADKEQANLRPGVLTKNKPPCVIYLGAG